MLICIGMRAGLIFLLLGGGPKQPETIGATDAKGVVETRQVINRRLMNGPS